MPENGCTRWAAAALGSGFGVSLGPIVYHLIKKAKVRLKNPLGE